MFKMSIYIRALKEMPDYFIDDKTKIATIDDTRMVVVNPQYAAMWYDGGEKKPRWKIIDPNSPFEYVNGELRIKED